MAEAPSLQEYVAKADPDRALCAYFLPEPARQDVFALLAVHDEITRALAPGRSAAVVGPMAAFVRLQWWREVLEGTRPPEHTWAPLVLAALERGSFKLETLLGVLEAREAELSPQPDPAVWAESMLKGSGGLQCAVGEALGVQHAELAQRLRYCGAAYGAAAMVRHGPALAQSGRYLYPGGPEGLKHTALGFLAQAQAGSVPPEWGVAFLPTLLAQRDLRRGPEQAGQPRTMADKLALMAAGFKAQWRARMVKHAL